MHFLSRFILVVSTDVETVHERVNLVSLNDLVWPLLHESYQ